MVGGALPSVGDRQASAETQEDSVMQVGADSARGTLAPALSRGDVNQVPQEMPKTTAGNQPCVQKSLCVLYTSR